VIAVFIPLTHAACRLLLLAILPLVPAGRRREWMEEWTAEIDARREESHRRGEAAAAGELLRLAAGALPHAWWMRRLEWSYHMTDIRYAFRLVARKPGFASVVVATLALGIGGATAMFSIVHGVLLEPLPYREPDRLVWMFGSFRGSDTAAVSPPDFLDYRSEQRTFSSIAAMTIAPSGVTVAGAGGPERLLAGRTTAAMLTTLGVRPALGRDFQTTDESLSAPRVAIISDRLWQERFARARDVVGQTIVVDRRAHAIVGVLPAGFELPFDPFIQLSGPLDLLLPFPFDAEEATVRRFHFLRAIGRLAPARTLSEAQRHMDVIARRLEQAYPENETWRLRLLPLHERLVGQVRPALLMLLAAVGLLLLIACANVMSLLLAMATTRQSEIAVRAALGASRGRIVRQLLTEGLVLALLGGTAGLALASWIVGVVKRAAPASIPRLEGVGIDPVVVGFSAGIACVATLVFALAPAVRIVRSSDASRMKEGARGADGSERASLRRGLVVTQIALSLALLVGAGLLARSLARLQAVEVGFASDVLLAAIALPAEVYGSLDEVEGFFTALSERLNGLPGVEAAALATSPPLAGANDTSVYPEGEPPAAPADRRFAQIRWVQGDYFGALAIPVLRGRVFDDRADGPGAPPVVVISRAMAEKFFPGKDPIGERLVVDLQDAVTVEVAGVVGDARVFGQAEDAPAMLYMSSRQFPTNYMHLIVRTAAASAGMGASIRGTVQALDPALSIARLESMRDLLRDSVAQPRLRTILVAAFAAVALVMSLTGVYGIVAFTVGQRTREIGIRLALGATGHEVVRMIMRQGAVVVGLGLLVGLALAFGASRLLASLLYEMGPNDPLVFTIVPLAVGAAALMAAALPARRAARIEPVRALRSE
jgi:putative ABC transport system permease protein